MPSDKGFSHALLSPIFAVYGTGVLPCVGYLAADGTVYCLAADTHYYVDDLRDAGLGLAAGFRLKAAELPSSVALVGGAGCACGFLLIGFSVGGTRRIYYYFV